jgi:hypothetical protein
MYKICLIALIFLWGVSLAAYGICDARQAAEKSQGGNQARTDEPHKARTGKAHGGAGFSGVVVGVDPATKIISVRGRGKTVAFDASNPTLRGFRSFDDIRVGRTIAVSYSRSGLRISKSSRVDPGPEEVRERPVAGKKSAHKRMRVQAKGTSFRDVDENKDGRVTPVELSVVVTDLTMEQFKAYDRNGDGSLSETEYRAVRRNH